MVNVCIIGYGEAGGIFSANLANRCSLRVYDILIDSEAFLDSVESIRDLSVLFSKTLRSAIEGADLVISLVTADAALEVAESAASVLQAGQVYLDLNSVSPGTKKKASLAVERSGAIYIDGAVMAPVPPHGLAVPILICGPHAFAAETIMTDLGMNLTVVSDQVGVASATKMCRSVIVKGIESLCIEAFLAARAHGVEERVLASLAATLPGTDWQKFAGYQIGRSLVHGRRRAAEMREVAFTVREAGIEPQMSLATAFCQDWAADISEAYPVLKLGNDGDWVKKIDVILTVCAEKAADLANSSRQV